MKRILFFFLLTALPFLAAAQTVKDSVTVLTDAQINFGTWADSVRMYFIQGGTWKKQRMDTLAQYVATKNGTGVTDGDKGDITVSGSGATWTIDNGVITTAKIGSAAVDSTKLATGAVVLDGAKVTGTLPISKGGTNATTAPQARTNLGLAIGTDVLAPNGSAANLTNFPTLNQNTTGSAASLTTARDIQVNLASTIAASFNGTANIQPGVTGQLGGGNIADGAISGAKTNFAGVSGDAARLLGAVSGGTTDTVQVGGGLALSGGVLRSKQDTMAMVIACSDETTAITATGTRVTFRAPFAMTIVGVRASLTTASSSGLPRVDIFENTGSGFTSIFSTRLTINQGALTSVGATTPAVITDPNIANDSAIRIDYDQVGTGAAGLKVTILYIRP